MIGQGESELNVSPDVEWREVEYGKDGTGCTTYRHVVYTEWQVLPGD